MRLGRGGIARHADAPRHSLARRCEPGWPKAGDLARQADQALRAMATGCERIRLRFPCADDRLRRRTASTHSLTARHGTRLRMARQRFLHRAQPALSASVKCRCDSRPAADGPPSGRVVLPMTQPRRYPVGLSYSADVIQFCGLRSLRRAVGFFNSMRLGPVLSRVAGPFCLCDLVHTPISCCVLRSGCGPFLRGARFPDLALLLTPAGPFSCPGVIS
jgi:hypothetical protein